MPNPFGAATRGGTGRPRDARNEYAGRCDFVGVPPSGRPGDALPSRAAPAGATPKPAKRLVNICRLRVPLPDSAWIARFSQLHPDVRIQVLSRLDIDRRRSLTEVQLRTAEAGAWAEEIGALPQVEEVEALESEPDRIHLRVIHRTSEFVPIFRELHLMRRFPFEIRAGEASWVVVAPESKIRLLLRRLEAQAPGATLESVRHTDPGRTSGPLTPRQADLLRRAMAAGYFEVPRKITLTGLARHLEMAPSSLSEALAIVEKKLLERWPTGDGPGSAGASPEPGA